MPVDRASSTAGSDQPFACASISPNTNDGSPSTSSTAPIGSPPARGRRGSCGRAASVSVSDTAATGALIQKFHGQLAYCVSAPPIAGPAARNSIGMPAYTAIALPRSPGAKLPTTRLALAGCMSAAAAPCSARHATIDSAPVANPQPTLAPVKASMPATNAGTLPKASAARPPSATRLASARMYAFTTHCTWTSDRPRSRWIAGSDTPTTVTSSMIMLRLPVIASSVSHLRGAPCSSACVTPPS